MQDTQENNSRKSSWKYLERAPLCFQVAFSLPAWWNLFQMIHPEMRTFNFSFTLDRATRNQGSSGSFTLKHLKSIKSSQISPTALSWFIQQTQTSSQSSQWHKMKLNSRRNTIYHFGSRTKLKECSVITSNLACPSSSLPSGHCTLPPNTVRFNNACDHCPVTIGHTCCWLTCVTGTLLTLMRCGTSANEASSTSSTSEDYFGGGGNVCLKLFPISHVQGGKGMHSLCTGPFTI